MSPNPLRRFAACGFAGTTLIAIGGLAVGPPPHSTRLAAPIFEVFGSPGAVALVYAGVALLVGTWLAVGRALKSGAEFTTPALLGLVAIWALPLALGPPLFSRDVYAYAAQGRMVSRGLNPYHYGPAALGGGERILTWVAPLWVHARAPYGPLFLGLNHVLLRSVGGNLVAAVFGLRAIELAGMVLVAVFLPRLATHHGVRPADAVWLGLLNPLVLLHFVSGAHNDALMVGLLVAGLAVAADGRPVLGLVACTLAAAVKAPAGLGVIYVALEWSAPHGLREISWTTLARAVAVVTAGFVAVTEAVGLGWGWVMALAPADHVRTLLSAMTDLGILIAAAEHRLGLTVSSGSVISVTRAVGGAIAVLTTIGLLVARRRIGWVRAAALGLLAWVALGPAVQPWYLTWGLVPLAAAGSGRMGPVLVWLSVGLSLLVGPGGSSPDALVIAFVAATMAMLLATVAGHDARISSGRYTAADPEVRRAAPLEGRVRSVRRGSTAGRER